MAPNLLAGSLLGILSQRIIPAFEYAFPRGFPDAAGVTIQPKRVKSARSLKIVTHPDGMSVNAAIPVCATPAITIVGEIDPRGTREEHVRLVPKVAVFNPWFHVGG